MNRILRTVGVATFALLVLSALVASAAQAVTGIAKPAEPIRLTVTPDGTGTTAHHVLDVAGTSTTCPQMTGEATVAGTGTSFTTWVLENIVYNPNCKLAGQSAHVVMNGCKYDFGISGGAGTMTIQGCNAGKTIEHTVTSPACLVTIPEQGPLGGVTYHNPNPNEVTVEMHVTGIKYTVDGPSCPVVNGTYTNGNYTTGNFILTAEKDNGSQEMVPIQAINPDPTP